MSIFYFIIGLGLLIFIHELGHFLVAKWNGIRVERFSLGFGPRILKYTVGETEYCVSLLPLGGYVKMSGQEDFGEEEIKPLDDPRAFSSKSLGARLQVVLAGPGMNLLLPFILMPLVFMVGRSEPKYLQALPQVIGVRADSPAAKAGIESGDLIVSVNQQPVSNWDDVLKRFVSSPQDNFRLQIKRQNENLEKDIKLEKQEDTTIPVAGIEPAFFFDMDPVLGEVSANSPASQAGLQSGDKILQIDKIEIKDWNQLTESVNNSAGKNIELLLDRKGEKVTASVKPIFNKQAGRYVMGVAKGSNPDYYLRHRYGFAESFSRGAQENWVLVKETFKVLKKLFTFQASYKELGGPIRIAQISAKAAEKGIADFLYLLAFLSIQLGVLNLLPIPVLDGGHVAFMSVEAILRKPIPPKKKMIAQQVGMFLLLTLMVLVTVNDIDSVWGFGKMIQAVKGWFQ